MGTYTDGHGDLVTYDLTTGEIISTQPAGSFPTTTDPSAVVAPPIAPAAPPVAPPGQDPNASAISPGSSTPPSPTVGQTGAAGLDASKKLHGTHPIIQGPNGGFYYSYSDNTFSPLQPKAPDLNALQQAELAKTNAETNRILAGGQSASAGAALAGHQLQAGSAAAQLAEQKRQFDENQGFEKAKFNENYAFNQGKELLGLGSRPDTLVKYLYALKGMQAPQAVAGTTNNLPGFGNLATTPGAPTAQTGPAPVAQAPAQAAAAQTPTTANVGLQTSPGTQQQLISQELARAGASPQTFASNNLTIPGLGPKSALPTTVGPAPSLAPTPSAQWGKLSGTGGYLGYGVGEAPQYTADEFARADRPDRMMAAGGVIPEPVIGIGLHSGQTYTFGEKRPEKVVPYVPGARHYDTGGPIGVPSVGPDDSSNPPPAPSNPDLVPQNLLGTTNVETGNVLEGGTAAPALGGPIGTGTTLMPPDFDAGATLGDRGLGAPPPSAPVIPPSMMQQESMPIGDRGEASPDLKVLIAALLESAGRLASRETEPTGGGHIPFLSSMGRPGLVPGDRRRPNQFAAGGVIGYNPTLAPSSQTSTGFFNDPNLQNVVQRGYNSNPQVPLFPQINYATNGGQSMVASQQRLNNLLPSERALYGGTLQDEFGAQPDDVFSLARKLAPQVTGLRTPHFAA